jgi:hypothetical protein
MVIAGKYPGFMANKFPISFAYSGEHAITVMNRPALNGRLRQQADLCRHLTAMYAIGVT